jgi:hypothetical protein
MNLIYSLFVIACILVAEKSLVDAFTVCCTRTVSSSSSSSTTTVLRSETSNNSRRQFFASLWAGGVAAASGLVVAPPEEAHATYSAYVNREKDWTERNSRGQVQYQTAKDLRRQLAEIAPMNTDNSKIFCPNGPTANVSPLMENKCSDKLAMPSVFGRSDDVLGNSIPGRNAGGISSSATTTADIGGLPAYGFTTNSRQQK